MNKTLIYQFQDISFTIHSNNTVLIKYMDDYTNLYRVNTPAKKNINMYFTESESLDDFINTIDSDAKLLDDRDAVLDGDYRYLLYSSSNDSRWVIIDKIGAVYISNHDSIINTVIYGSLSSSDILQFLMFCSNPMIRILRDNGYVSLHSACINIGNKNALITGLSGRGKSTATFALLESAHTAITDESTLIKNENGTFKAYSLMNWIKVEKGAKDVFFSDIGDRYIRCQDAYIIRLTDINKCENYIANTIDYIFILEQTGIPKTSIVKAGPLDVIRELFPVTLSRSSKEYTDYAFSTISDLLDSIECYKVLFGTDMKQFSQQIDALVLGEDTI